MQQPAQGGRLLSLPHLDVRLKKFLIRVLQWKRNKVSTNRADRGPKHGGENNCVSHRPVLWDMRLLAYRDRSKEAQKLGEISKLLNLPGLLKVADYKRLPSRLGWWQPVLFAARQQHDFSLYEHDKAHRDSLLGNWEPCSASGNFFFGRAKMSSLRSAPGLRLSALYIGAEAEACSMWIHLKGASKSRAAGSLEQLINKTPSTGHWRS